MIRDPHPVSPFCASALHGLFLVACACSVSEPAELELVDEPSAVPSGPVGLLASGDPAAAPPADATAASCPAGSEVMLGTALGDYLHAALPQSQVCVVGAEGDDRILDETRDRGTLMGGPGHDSIYGSGAGALVTGNEGDDLVVTLGANDEIYGGDGLDEVRAGGGNDYVEGGEGSDELHGDEGRDRLLGQAGDDALHGGADDDALLGGAGLDAIKGGEGDDFAAILHACQVGPGEVLDGGPGVDVLLSPLDAHELELLGVTVNGFEKVVKVPGDAFGCDPVTCTCPDAFAANVEVDPCDFDYLIGTPDIDPVKLRASCESFVGSIPSLLAALPPEPTQEDFEAVITSDPKWLQTFAQLGALADHHTPGEGTAEFPGTPAAPGAPQPGVIMQDREPCDRPDEPLAIQVAVGGINNCTAGEEALVEDRVDLASFLRWRMDQQLRPIVMSAADPAAAQALWQQGDFRYSMEYWFGEYDADRAAAALQTVDELWDALHADDGAEHVQCYHPLTWWQGILLAAFSPPTLMHKTHLNVCFLSDHTSLDALAHATFAAPTSPASAVLYPPNSIELCAGFFDDYDPNDVGDQSFQATVIMHELLHWTFNDIGMLRDLHGSEDDGICPITGCLGVDMAHELAEQAPDVAVKNIHNYNEWAHVVAGAYLEGYCDDVWDAPCKASPCGGGGGSRPASYADCGLDPLYCADAPEDCHTWGDAGNCAGGPCLRTNPGHRTEGQLDPHADFHPKGDFRDALGNLHRCEPIDGQETTCVDENGWGVCRKCGTGPGESLRGCSCSNDDDCWSPEEALSCFGGEFPGGGFCWPLAGPPEFQCAEGECGQAYGPGGGSYCEHYPEGGSEARCQPQWCADLQAELCTGAGTICTDGFDGSPNDPSADCQGECQSDADCSPVYDWPLGYGCVGSGNGSRCMPQ